MLTATATATATAIDAGAAWYEEAWYQEAWYQDVPARRRALLGAVCAVFRHACYLRFGDRVVALCDARAAPGPLHLRVRTMPPVAAGDPVVLRDGSLETRLGAIMVPPDRRWAPDPVDRDALEKAVARRRDRGAIGGGPSDLDSGGGSSDLDPGGGPSHLDPGGASSHLDPRGGSSLLDPGGASSQHMLDRLADLVDAGDLVTLARTVGGRGPGLTPAGDDFLAGVLVADAVRHPERVDERRQAATAARTTDVAAAFLRWAAVGQCIQPLHDVLSAIASEEPAREDEARAQLRAIGASSGAVLLLGLDVALSAA